MDEKEKPESGRLDTGPAGVCPLIPLAAPFNSPQLGMIKIGAAGRKAGVSVQAIRLYEAEGLLISFKSKAGTRWYSERDVQWIARIKGLLSKGLNFEGIRRLLAQIPCWSLRPCTPELHSACSMHHQNRLPCWSDPARLCPEKLRECYHCGAYGRAREFVNLKAHAEIVPIC